MSFEGAEAKSSFQEMEQFLDDYENTQKLFSTAEGQTRLKIETDFKQRYPQYQQLFDRCVANASDEKEVKAFLQGSSPISVTTEPDTNNDIRDKIKQIFKRTHQAIIPSISSISLFDAGRASYLSQSLEAAMRSIDDQKLIEAQFKKLQDEQSLPSLPKDVHSDFQQWLLPLLAQMPPHIDKKPTIDRAFSILPLYARLHKEGAEKDQCTEFLNSFMAMYRVETKERDKEKFSFMEKAFTLVDNAQIKEKGDLLTLAIQAFLSWTNQYTLTPQNVILAVFEKLIDPHSEPHLKLQDVIHVCKTNNGYKCFFECYHLHPKLMPKAITCKEILWDPLVEYMRQDFTSSQGVEAFIDLWRSPPYPTFFAESVYQFTFSPLHISKLRPLLVWCAQQPDKATICNLLDKLTALSLKNPPLLDELLDFPPNEYPFLQELLAKFNDAETLTNAHFEYFLLKRGMQFKNMVSDLRAKESIIKKAEELAQINPSFAGFLKALQEVNGGQIIPPDIDRSELRPYFYLLNRLMHHADNAPLMRLAIRYPYEASLKILVSNVETFSIPLAFEDPQQTKKRTGETLEAMNTLTDKEKLYPLLLSLGNNLRNAENMIALYDKLGFEAFKAILESNLIYRHCNTLLQDDTLCHRLRTLIEFEKKENLSLSMYFLGDISLLKGGLFDAISNNIDFARQLSTAFSNKNAVGRPLHNIIHSINEEMSKPNNDALKKAIFERIALCHEMPQISNVLLENIEKTEDISSLRNLYRKIQSESECSLERLNALFIAEKYNPSITNYRLHDRLLALHAEHPKIMHALLDMVKQGVYAKEVDMLLRYVESNSKNATDVALLHIASSHNAPLIQKIMEMRYLNKNSDLLAYFLPLRAQDNLTLYQNLLEIRAKKTFPNLEKGLIEIIETTSLEVRDKRWPNWRNVIACAENGFFPQANKWLETPGNLFCEAPPSLNIVTTQKIMDLQNDLYQNGKATSEYSRTIEIFITNLISQKVADDTISDAISNIQFLLQHSPSTLQIIERNLDAQTTDFDNILKEINKKTNDLLDEKLHTYIFGNVSRKVSQEELKAGSILMRNLTLGISHLLITPGGSLNSALIKKIKATQAYGNYIENAPKNLRLEEYLDFLATEPRFDERLRIVKAPQNATRQQAIIKALLGTREELTTRDCQVAVLSALLWEVRQGYIGNCFASNIFSS